MASGCTSSKRIHHKIAWPCHETQELLKKCCRFGKCKWPLALWKYFLQFDRAKATIEFDYARQFCSIVLRVNLELYDLCLVTTEQDSFLREKFLYGFERKAVSHEWFSAGLLCVWVDHVIAISLFPRVVYALAAGVDPTVIDKLVAVERPQIRFVLTKPLCVFALAFLLDGKKTKKKRRPFFST